MTNLKKYLHHQRKGVKSSESLQSHCKWYAQNGYPKNWHYLRYLSKLVKLYITLLELRPIRCCWESQLETMLPFSSSAVHEKRYHKNLTFSTQLFSSNKLKMQINARNFKMQFISSIVGANLEELRTYHCWSWTPSDVNFFTLPRVSDIGGAVSPMFFVETLTYAQLRWEQVAILHSKQLPVMIHK